MLGLLVGAIALCGGGILAWNEGSIEYQIVAVVGWAFFGLGSLFLVKKIIKRTPSLIVNYSGIFDNSSAYGAYFLRWDEIESIGIESMKVRSSRHQIRLIAIRLKDPEAFLAQQSAFKAFLLRWNIKLVGTPVTISTNTLPMKLEELLAVIRAKSASAARAS